MPKYLANYIPSSYIADGDRSALTSPYSRRNFREDVMQMAITFIAVVGGMVLSLAVALLAEELIFGQVFRLFFSQQALAVKRESRR